jgi:hypothetical protein
VIVKEYLDAECVLGILFEKNILTRREWKNKSNQMRYYYVRFEHTGSARVSSFVIYVNNSKHCIGKRALENQAMRFGFDCGEIYEECKIAT